MLIKLLPLPLFPLNKVNLRVVPSPYTTSRKMLRVSQTLLARSGGGSHGLKPSRVCRALVQVETRGGAAGGGGGNFHTVSLGDIQEDGAMKPESGINVMRSIKSAQLAESFYFPTEAKDYCRLCECEVNVTPRMHIAASSRQSHTNHTCREVVFDSLTLLGRKGYSVDHILEGWAHSLYVHEEFPRIHALTDWSASVEERAAKVKGLLHTFKEMHILDLSLAVVVPSGEGVDQQYHSRRKLAFERLENIGDNSWGSNLSKRMTLCFPDRQWTNGMASYTFNCFRDACEMNLNLEMVYDLLDLGSLFTEAEREKLGTGKVRSDVLESLLGELVMYQYGLEPQIYESSPFYEVNGGGQMRLHCLVEHTLTEIFDTMFLNYVRQLLGTAIPLSKELASKHVWAVEFPLVTPVKDRVGATRKRDNAVAFRRRMLLPADAPLHTNATPFPVQGALRNPLREDPTLVPDAIDSFRGTDVFARMLPSVVEGEQLAVQRAPEHHDAQVAAGTRCVRTAPLSCTSDRTASRHVSSERLNLRGLNDSLKLAIGDGAVDMLLRLGGEGGQLYFRDVMYDLSPTRTSHTGRIGRGNIMEISPRPSTPTEGALPTTNPPEVPAAPATRSLTIEASAHQEAASSNASDSGSRDGWVNSMLFVYPHLAKERQGIQALPGFALGGRTLCMFQPSALVPDDVKPPAAGAITDKNLFFGLFLGVLVQGGADVAVPQTLAMGAGGGVSVTNAPLSPEQQSLYF